MPTKEAGSVQQVQGPTQKSVRPLGAGAATCSASAVHAGFLLLY